MQAIHNVRQFLRPKEVQKKVRADQIKMILTSEILSGCLNRGHAFQEERVPDLEPSLGSPQHLPGNVHGRHASGAAGDEQFL